VRLVNDVDDDEYSAATSLPSTGFGDDVAAGGDTFGGVGGGEAGK